MTDQTPSQLSKADRFLLLGAAIPILFILLVLGVRAIHDAGKAVPQYGFVLAEYNTPSSDKAHKFAITDGTLSVTAEVSEYSKLRLLVFTPGKTTPKEVIVKPDSDIRKAQTLTASVKLPDGMGIDPRKTSPDGFKLHAERYNDSDNIYTELFMSDRDRNRPYLNGPSGPYYFDADLYYYDAKFVGWIVPQEMVPPPKAVVEGQPVYETEDDDSAE